MAYSPGEQPPGTNSNANSHCKTRSHQLFNNWFRCVGAMRCSRCKRAHYSFYHLVLAVPGVSGGSVATGNGSGSIPLNFDNEEPTRSNGAGQPLQRQPPQQPGGWDSGCFNVVDSPWEQMGVSLFVAGYQSAPETRQAITSSVLYHKFAVPQHPGRAVPPSFAGLDNRLLLVDSCSSNTQDSSSTPEESQERGSANRNRTALGRRMV